VTDPRTRLTRALLLAAASLALVALIAVAAGGYRLGGSSSSHASPYAIDTILSIVIALYLVAAVAVVVAMFWSGLELRRAQRQRPRGERVWRTILLLLVAAVLVVVAAQRYHLRAHPRAPAETPAAGKATRGLHKKAGAPKPRQAHIRLAPLLAVLGAGGIAFAAFLLAEKRRRGRLPSDWRITEALSDVLDETLDDLRAESDPRRAVIAAYARMERALAAHGVPRRRFEAPHEYLGRVLAELTGGRLAASRLTALFERARFSPHEIDGSMKIEAIEAIESLQADLAAAEAVKAAA
jgi:beta-lactamase regulating signal transducer with metallopeptidase domain